MNFKRSVIVTSSLILLAGCGGGNSGSSVNLPSSVDTPAPVIPPVSTSLPMIDLTTSKSSVVEGQNFVLDALGSTDPNGRDLTYLWSQISGTTVEISSPSNGQLDLEAPLIDIDETLEFRLEVSNGLDTVVESISVNVSNLAATEFTSETSSVSNNTLSRIAGLTPEPNGGFRAFWAITGGELTTSSQAFDGSGTRDGDQIDGRFLTGSVDRFAFLEDVILSAGNPHYMLNTTFSTGRLEDDFRTEGVSFHKGLLSSISSPPAGTQIFSKVRPSHFFQDSVASMQDEDLTTDHIITVVTADENDPFDDEGNLIRQDTTANAVILNSDGTFSDFLLDTSPFNMGPPAVAPLTSGNFVAAYSINAPDRTDLFMAKANLNGTNISSRIPIAQSNIVNAEYDPNVAKFSNGNALIVWRETAETVTDTQLSSLQGQIIDSQGNLVAMKFTINDTTEGNPSNPHIQPLNADNALVVWESSQAGLREIRGVVINSSGEKMSNEFLFDSRETYPGLISFYSVDLSDDRVALSWKIGQAGPIASTSQIIIFDAL